MGPGQAAGRDQGLGLRSVFPVEPILAPRGIIVVTTGLIFVSIIVLIAKVAMISPVFSATLETVLVSTLMLVRQLLMVPVVGTITVVVIVVSKCGDDRCAQH